VAALAIPLATLVIHYSTRDRSGDNRDAANGARILAAAAPNAVIWSYWDVRTTLEYLHSAEHVRPDVDILDHRAYGRYGCPGCEGSGDAVVALGVASDPSLANRPFYYVPLTQAQLDSVAQKYRVKPVVRIETPFGFDYRGTGWLYRVER
jgi:hypothetical protein